jgi:hypothetical protein
MTTWRHLHCDNEPEHVQEFPDGPQGSFGPQAGDRCDGCDRPTALYDWVQIIGSSPGHERDLSSCPYYTDALLCRSGCVDEPACITQEPLDGWPSKRVAVQRVAEP